MLNPFLFPCDGRARPIRTGQPPAISPTRTQPPAPTILRSARASSSGGRTTAARQTGAEDRCRLLADDAVTASSRLAGMTDRSLRRLLGVWSRSAPREPALLVLASHCAECGALFIARNED